MSRYAEFQGRLNGTGRPGDFHRALADLSDYIRTLTDESEGMRCHVLYTETLQWLLEEASPAYLAARQELAS